MAKRWLVTAALVVTAAGCGWRRGNDAAVGSALRPLVVGLVAWPGYAAGIYANGGFETEAGSIYERAGLHVRFVLIEDLDARGKALAKGGPDGIDAAWSTVDFFANESPNFKRAGIPVASFMQVDWSSGGDAIVAGPGIRQVRDLVGKSVALVQFTPSHWLLEHAMEEAHLPEGERKKIRDKLVFSQDLTSVRQAFVTGQVDSAVLWEPDVSEALARRGGAHIVVSTATTPNLIADVIMARRNFIRAHGDALARFAGGWLDAAPMARGDVARTVSLLMKTEILFRDLGPALTERSLSWVHLAGLDDNIRMFGLNGSPPEFDALFSNATEAWRKLGYVTTPLTPLEAKDDAILRQVVARR